MQASELPKHLARIEREARDRGETIFPDLPAPPGLLGVVAASGTAIVMNFVGVLKPRGGGYDELRGYIVVVAIGLVGFLWARNAVKRREEAIGKFVSQELSTAIAQFNDRLDAPLVASPDDGTVVPHNR